MLSAVATKALAIIIKSDVTNQQIDQLIRQDPGLASRVLHIANSPFFSGKMRSCRIADAIVRLGMRQLRKILALAATSDLFDATDPIVRNLWRHSQEVAAASDLIFHELDLRGSEDAFIGGLMHDIGKFIICHQQPQAFAAASEAAELSGRSMIDIELEHFRYFTHTSVGALVIQKWQLSDAVVEAARFHHLYAKAVPECAKHLNLIAIVALADLIVNKISLPGLTGNLSDSLELPFVRQLRLAPERLHRLYNSIAKLCLSIESGIAAEA